ncbi:sterol-sensing domain of SREBP cleavage-activation-domain-containing protein [Kockovaella imperatae]|uniref:Sterol regulatory element-binding protein cleavage-activating protein n=1 Tax=Kockovaella imperatae TaxID=4999 RepID=A0A1Y1U6N5_9TREE|nr:sterol-sensing domain of SREBP cleavage-activation-domain-containing protein [Kockovaella imperatae]ORX33700.1 sterol-sensing domain of SREBP cleavage-activation-domain-containing protein [Kockovaella imperatae]
MTKIRVLLIDCLVMTNLFYPALSIYLQQKFPPLHPPAPPSHNAHRYSSSSGSKRRVTKEHPLSLLSTPWLDTFFPYPPPLLPRLTWESWWSPDPGQETTLGWSGSELKSQLEDDEVKLLRVGWTDVGGILDHDETGTWNEHDDVVLDLIRSTAEEWEATYSSEGESCVRKLERSSDGLVRPSGPCVVVSPESKLEGPLAISKLVTGSPAPEGSPISRPQNWPPIAGKVYRSAGVLMRIPSASATDFEERWAKAMEEVASTVTGELFPEPPRPAARPHQLGETVALAYRSANTSSSEIQVTVPDRQLVASVVPRFIIILYLIFIVLLGSQLSTATQVHSRYGLAVTGIVQVCCSSIMSYSVLSLLGLQIGTDPQAGSLPMYILPFVVVVVGAENMATLTKAVFSVPFSHSVPARIGMGLSKVGPGIAWASFTDLCILALVSLCVNVRPVTEFCRFASLVIITDWFMLHTFFLTVLSIDAQRLELADVLANPDGTSPRARSASSGRPRRSLLRRWTRARRNKSGSLIIILISIGAIYYVTESRRSPATIASLYGYTPSVASILPKTTPFITSAHQLFHLTPSEQLWRSLNPMNLAHIKMSVPRASLIILPKVGHKMQPAGLRRLQLPTSRILLPRLKPIFYLFKVVILPQAVTAGTLYGLLLYLLKDSQLLDSQRHALGRVDPPAGEQSGTEALDSGAVIDILPCSHAVDVDRIGVTSDGKLALSIDGDNTLFLWRFGQLGTGTRETLSTSEIKDDPIVACLLNHDWAILGSQRGYLYVWKIGESGPARALQPIPMGEDDLRISAMSWGAASPTDPFQHPGPTGSLPTILVAMNDGSVISKGLSDAVSKVVVPPCGGENRVRTSFLNPLPDLQIIISAGHTLTKMHTPAAESWISRDIAVSDDPADRLECVAACPNGLAFAFRSGLIQIRDLDGNPMYHFRLPLESLVPPKICRIELAAPNSSKCSTCGSITNKSLFTLVSTADQVIVHHAAPRGHSLCKCSRDTMSDGKLGIPPRRSPLTTPQSPPLLLPSLSNDSAATSLSHRARRPSSMGRENSYNGHAAVQDDFDHQILGKITTRGGGRCWRVGSQKAVGLRRSGNGIDERSWEIWTLDLGQPWNGRNLLVKQSAFGQLLRHTETRQSDQDAMRMQRDERQLALNGQVPFPSLTIDATAQTGLAFVDIRTCAKSKSGMLVGMGNRIAVLETGEIPETSRRGSTLGIALTPPPPKRELESKKTT